MATGPKLPVLEDRLYAIVPLTLGPCPNPVVHFRQDNNTTGLPSSLLTSSITPVVLYPLSPSVLTGAPSQSLALQVRNSSASSRSSFSQETDVPRSSDTSHSILRAMLAAPPLSHDPSLAPSLSVNQPGSKSPCSSFPLGSRGNSPPPTPLSPSDSSCSSGCSSFSADHSRLLNRPATLPIPIPLNVNVPSYLDRGLPAGSNDHFPRGLAMGRPPSVRVHIPHSSSCPPSSPTSVPSYDDREFLDAESLCSSLCPSPAPSSSTSGSMPSLIPCSDIPHLYPRTVMQPWGPAPSTTSYGKSD